MDQIRQLTEQIKKTSDHSEMTQLAREIKKSIVRLGVYTLSHVERKAPSSELVDKLVAARDALEACLIAFAIAADIEAVHSYFNLLDPIYHDTRGLPPSQNQMQCYMLVMMSDLAQHPADLSHFHSLIDLNPSLCADPLVAQILTLERSFTEGALFKAFDLIASLSLSPAIAPFTPLLTRVKVAARDKAAVCIQATCSTFPVDRLKDLLCLADFSDADLQAFASERGWVVADGIVMMDETSPPPLPTSQEYVVDLVRLSAQFQ